MSGASGRLLLVVWEVADWELLHPLIDRGELPVLGRLVNEGAGGGLSSPPPPVSSSQWTTIATGKRAWQHQVQLLFQANGKARTVVEANARASRSVWEILSEQGQLSVVVGWPATHGGSFPGISVSDRFHMPTAPPGLPWPGAVTGTYHPAGLAARLDVLRVSPQEIDPGAIAHYVPEWRKVDQRRDPILAKLRILLAADFSYQAAITALLEAEPWAFAAVRFPAMGEICRLFARHYLFADTPSAKPVAMFRDVLPTAYRTLDAMLGRLVELAGSDAAIVLVSPNGLTRHSAEAYAANGESWQRPGGIFLAAGPGFTQDTLLHGASTLDVTPTLLNWFGLPIGRDMDGRPPAGCLADSREIPMRESWDSEHRTESEARVADLREELLPTDRSRFDWNRVQSLLDAGRVEDALPLLEALFRECPENPTFSQTLFQTQLSLGRHDAAEETLDVLVEALPPAAAAIPRAELALARGDLEGARRHLTELLESPAQSSPLWHRIGLLLVALREWEKLEACARTVLEQNQDDEIAWLGLAEASLRRRDFDTAAQAAQRAIGLRFFLPQAHLVLTRALVGKGMYLAAIQAAERLLQIQPSNELARNYLRRLRRLPAP